MLQHKSHGLYGRMKREFPCGSVGSRSGIVPAAAWVAAVAQVRSLNWEHPLPRVQPKKKKKKKRERERERDEELGPFLPSTSLDSSKVVVSGC